MCLSWFKRDLPVCLLSNWELAEAPWLSAFGNAVFLFTLEELAAVGMFIRTFRALENASNWKQNDTEVTCTTLL